MSVYKEEASASVDMDQIYIPLRVVPEGAVEADAQGTRADPASLLTPGPVMSFWEILARASPHYYAFWLLPEVSHN